MRAPSQQVVSANPSLPVTLGTMTALFSGQTVRVITEPLGDGKPKTEFYIVAEPRPLKAEAIIRAAIGATSAVRVDAIAPRSPAEMKPLHLMPGQYTRK
jgi:hypothetical protein